jgi:hypothetical protein
MNIKNNGKVNLIGTTLNYYKPWVESIMTGTKILL